MSWSEENHHRRFAGFSLYPFFSRCFSRYGEGWTEKVADISFAAGKQFRVYWTLNSDIELQSGGGSGGCNAAGLGFLGLVMMAPLGLLRRKIRKKPKPG